MRPECLAFSTPECLELVQYHNPKLWLVDITKPLTAIIGHRSDNRTTLKKSMEAIMERKTRMADKILVMAAYQHIMNEKVKMYEETVANINLYIKQMDILDRSTTVTEKDRKELREYYQDKLQDLKQEREALLKDSEVCKAIQAKYDEQMDVKDDVKK